jgi:hypothetical protein
VEKQLDFSQWLISENETMDAVKDMVSSGQITPAVLGKIAMPKGDGVTFTTETDEGTEELDFFEGIIVSIVPQRAYYKGKYKPGSHEEPTCFSLDCLTGQGDPGGDCGCCVLAQFAEDDVPSCRKRYRIMVLRKDLVIPDVLYVPPTSLTGVDKYLAKLAARARPVTSVVTKFSIERKTTRSGQAVSALSLSNLGRLTPDMTTRIRELSALLSSLKNAQPAQPAE